MLSSRFARSSVDLSLDSTAVHSDSSPAIEVVDVPGKGKGIVALRDLAEGDLLFVEKPLATLEWDMDYVESELNADLTRQIEALGEEDRQAYYSLHIADPVKFDYRPAAIFRTNAIGLGGSRHLGGAFKLASRFNHSCSTSVLYEWDEKDQVLLLKVVRNVAKGEELTAPYLSPLLPSGERQAYLKKHYGFTCRCQVCSLPPKELAKSDDRRAEISRIRDLVAKPPKPDSIPLKHHALCLSALVLLEEEGLRLGLEVYLAYTAFMMSVIYGYRKTADIWIDHLLQLEKRAHGVYTSLYRLFEIFKEDPSRNPGWRFIQRLESKLGRLNSLR